MFKYYLINAPLDQERRLASEKGYEDPVNVDYEATTASYERVAVELLDNASRRVKGEVQVLFATHNEDTIRTLVQLLVDERPAATRIVYVRLYVRLYVRICTYMYVYVRRIPHSAHSTPNPSTRQPGSV